MRTAIFYSFLMQIELCLLRLFNKLVNKLICSRYVFRCILLQVFIFSNVVFNCVWMDNFFFIGLFFAGGRCEKTRFMLRWGLIF